MMNTTCSIGLSVPIAAHDVGSGEGSAEGWPAPARVVEGEGAAAGRFSDGEQAARTIEAAIRTRARDGPVRSEPRDGRRSRPSRGATGDLTWGSRPGRSDWAAALGNGR